MILLLNGERQTASKQMLLFKKLGYETIYAKSHLELIQLYRKHKEVNLIAIDVDQVEQPSIKEREILVNFGVPLIYLASEIGVDKIDSFQNEACYGCIYKGSSEFVAGFTIRNALKLFEENKKLKKRKEQYEQAELISGFGYWELSLTEKTVIASKGARNIYGLEKGNLTLSEIKKVPLPRYREMLDKALVDMLEKGMPYDVEFKVENQSNGELITVHSVAEYDGKNNIINGTLYDISRQKKVEEIVREKEEAYRNIFENHHAVMLIVDFETRNIIHANPAASEYYGWTQEELSKMHITDLNTLSEEEIYVKIKEAESRGERAILFKHRLSDGRLRDVEVHTGIIMFRNKKSYFAIIHDVTTRKKAEKAMRHLAYYDSLTNLPNRKMFIDSLNHMISQGEKHFSKIALLYIDLDYFKEVNDIYGHQVGDRLLIKVAKRMKKKLPENISIFRLGGDEFSIIVSRFSGLEEIQYICDRVLGILKKPFDIKGKGIVISASIGISLYPENGSNYGTLLKNADIAMYRAKNSYKNGYCFF